MRRVIPWFPNREMAQLQSPKTGTLGLELFRTALSTDMETDYCSPSFLVTITEGHHL
jgi:hypothetical protein